MPYYDGAGTLDSPCTPITCASASANCNEHATCAEQAEMPFVTCTCMEGFTGNGVGADGCVAVVSPSAGPGSEGTPSAGAPGAANTPGKKVSGGSSTVVRGLAKAVLLVCFVALISF